MVNPPVRRGISAGCYTPFALAGNIAGSGADTELTGRHPAPCRWWKWMRITAPLRRGFLLLCGWATRWILHLKCIHMPSLMQSIRAYYQHTVVVRAFAFYFYWFSGALFVVSDDEPEVFVKRGNVINGYGKQFIVQNHTRVNRCENTSRWQEYIWLIPKYQLYFTPYSWKRYSAWWTYHCVNNYPFHLFQPSWYLLLLMFLQIKYSWGFL